MSHGSRDIGWIAGDLYPRGLTMRIKTGSGQTAKDSVTNPAYFRAATIGNPGKPVGHLVPDLAGSQGPWPESHAQTRRPPAPLMSNYTAHCKSRLPTWLPDHGATSSPPNVRSPYTYHKNAQEPLSSFQPTGNFRSCANQQPASRATPFHRVLPGVWGPPLPLPRRPRLYPGP